MAASIADVARLANVSISTVSRVLNRRELVNPQTCARVQSAIAQLGYTPNAFARGLMLRKSNVVGLMLPDLHGEFYSEVIRGANEQARTFGYNLMISSARDEEEGRTLLESLQQRTLLDGVAIMVSELSDHVQEARDLRLPYVLLDADVEGTLHDCVIIDQRHGAAALMRHLLGRCRAQRVVFIGGLATNVDTIARYEAYRQVLAEFERPLRDEDVHYLDYEYDTAYEFALEHVARWQGPGSAVFAANDEMAAGVLAAAQAAAVPLPERLQVVGFDDTRIARMTRPALTTVRVPMSRMGAEALRLLCERIADPQRAASRVILRPELVIRESCGGRGRRSTIIYNPAVFAARRYRHLPQARHAWLYALPCVHMPTWVRCDGALYRHIRTFKHDFFAATGLYEGPAGPCVLKLGRINPLFGLPLAWSGAFLRRQEQRAYQLAGDLPGVPRYIGDVGPTGFLHTYVPGRPLDKGDAVGDRFFDELQELVAQLHARGMAYVDLNKPQNVLLGEDGRPYLIDFQISLRVGRPSWGRPWRWPLRWALAAFQDADCYHLLKHKRRLRPDLLQPAERARLERLSIWIRLHRLLARPLTQLRRRLLRRLARSEAVEVAGSAAK